MNPKSMELRKLTVRIDYHQKPVEVPFDHDGIFKVKSEEVRAHFIPNLKDGVFVILCAPVVISILLSHTF